MKRKARIVVVSIAVALIAIAGIGASIVASGSGLTFPSLPSSNSVAYPSIEHTNELTQPASLLQVERDYAYRTGDPIDITVFVAEPDGISLDEQSFALSDTKSGDIEFSAHVLGSKQESNGVRVVAVAVELRKWSYTASFTVEASMSYEDKSTGDTKAFALSPVTIHMSPTWDGRKQLNPGNQQTIADEYEVWNYIFVATSLAVALAAVVFIRHARRINTRRRPVFVRPLTQLEQAREDFELTRDLIEGRDFETARYEELSRTLRQLFAIESLPTNKALEKVRESRPWAYKDTALILAHCDRRLYGDVPLSAADHAALFASFERILTNTKMHEPLQVVPPNQQTLVTRFVACMSHGKLRHLFRACSWCWIHRPFRYYQ